jgi:hypothetical protein
MLALQASSAFSLDIESGRVRNFLSRGVHGWEVGLRRMFSRKSSNDSQSQPAVSSKSSNSAAARNADEKAAKHVAGPSPEGAKGEGQVRREDLTPAMVSSTLR